MDDTFKWAGQMDVTATIDYLDSEPGFLGIEYDGSDVSAAKRGAYTRTSTIPLKGDHCWKKATFKMPRTRFTNSENGNADFRLVAETAEFAMRNVTVSR